MGRRGLLTAAFGAALLVCALPSAAAQPAPSFTPPAFYAVDDPTGSLSLDDVTRGIPSHQFRPEDQLPVIHGYRLRTRWYRFGAPNARDAPLLLQTDAEEAELYYRRNDGSIASARFGIMVPFSERAYKSPDGDLLLPAGAAAGSTMYARLYGSVIDIDIVPALADDARRLAQTQRFFAFLGLIGAVGFFSLVLAFYLRSVTYALNAVAQAALILYLLTYDGLSWQFLWPNASVAWVVMFNITGFLSLLATFLFVRSFLSLKTALPWVDRILWVAVAITGVNALAEISIFPDTGNFGYIPYRATWLILVVAALLRVRADRAARYLAVGLFALMFFVQLHVIAEVFHIAALGPILGFAAQSPYLVGGTIDAIMFQLALADRTLTTNRERVELQSKNLAAQDELLKVRAEAVARLETYSAAASHFVPSDFLKRLGREDIVSVRLGDHVEREMAILFSDIRSFATLSEAMTPEENFVFVNAYLARVSPVIREHGGFVDKYIGDAVMALFDDTAAAVDAAIALQGEVRRFNEARARALLAPIAVGVGLHWGKLMLGTVGEDERFDTTVISDAVNVAARLEELTKTFGAGIIASAAVVRAIGSTMSYNVRPLGSAQLKGMSHAIPVFEFCDADPPELLLHKMATIELFETALHAYDSGDFGRSGEAFAAIFERNAKDAPAAYFRARSAAASERS